jgi:molecular chaperone GrpE
LNLIDEGFLMSADLEKQAAAEKAAGPTPDAGEGQRMSSQDMERMQTLERENADIKDRLLRALAEMENLRRRTERELQDQRAYSITKFATDMVGTADNLRRALDAVPKPDEGEEDNAAIKALVDGVELTERELLKALERHGVKKREPVGERFDPHKDQAVFEIPDESVVSGTVLQVMQAGYMIGERVLRPSMVGVSKGGPARAPATEVPTENAGSPHVEPPRAANDPATKPRFDKKA